MEIKCSVIASISVSVLVALSQPVLARDRSSVGLEGFVDGCSTLVHIYERRDQKRLLAGQTTSLSEALRAGYCRGVIEQFQTDYRYRCDDNWFELADFVARQNGVEKKFGDINSILARACHDNR